MTKLDGARPRPGRLVRRPAWQALAMAVAVVCWASAGESAKHNDDPASRHLYYTGGVHNDIGCQPTEKCTYKREAGQPSDPLYPAWWTSQWTMYRVFKDYDKFPPPYGLPPAGLTADDYEVSYGASYYDSTVRSVGQRRHGRDA